MNVLFDSSFLFALSSPKDKKHLQAKIFIGQANFRYLVPDVVLAETVYMLRERVGLKSALNFLKMLVSERIELVPLTKIDILRAQEIMAIYDFDLADCCLLALAERLNITHICTFDERDFRQLRPKHTQYLLLLPMDAG